MSRISELRDCSNQESVAVQDKGVPKKTTLAKVTVRVDDVNEQPILPDQKRFVRENSALDAFVGAPLTVNDPDIGQGYTFTMEENEASKLFREQINEHDKDKITALIDLGEERLEVAKWSNIPYARPVHMGGGGGEGLSGRHLLLERDTK